MKETEKWSHLWQRVDHLWPQIETTRRSAAAERSVVSCWPPLITGLQPDSYKWLEICLCKASCIVYCGLGEEKKSDDLASTILLRIESTSRQLERVAPSRLGGTHLQLCFDSNDWLYLKINCIVLTCWVSLLRRHWLMSETRVSVR